MFAFPLISLFTSVSIRERRSQLYLTMLGMGFLVGQLLCNYSLPIVAPRILCPLLFAMKVSVLSFFPFFSLTSIHSVRHRWLFHHHSGPFDRFSFSTVSARLLPSIRWLLCGVVPFRWSADVILFVFALHHLCAGDQLLSADWALSGIAINFSLVHSLFISFPALLLCSVHDEGASGYRSEVRSKQRWHSQRPNNGRSQPMDCSKRGSDLHRVFDVVGCADRCAAMYLLLSIEQEGRAENEY